MGMSDTATLRPDLGICAEEFALLTGRFVGLKMLPVIRTKVKAGDYAKINRESLLQEAETARAAKATYARIDWKYGKGSFSTSEEGVEDIVDDSDATFASTSFDAEEISTKICSNIILTNLEKRIAALLFNETTFTPTELAIAWSNKATAVPTTNIDTGKKAIRDATGLIANRLLLGYDAFITLKENASIIDRIKYSNADFAKNGSKVTEALLAQLFDLEEVVVGDAIRNTAAEGQPSVIGEIWNPDYAMLAVTSESESIKQPCVGRTFLWEEDSPDILTVESYREEQVRSSVVRVRQNTEEQIILPEAAILFKGVMTQI